MSVLWTIMRFTGSCISILSSFRKPKTAMQLESFLILIKVTSLRLEQSTTDPRKVNLLKSEQKPMFCPQWSGVVGADHHLDHSKHDEQQHWYNSSFLQATLLQLFVGATCYVCYFASQRSQFKSTKFHLFCNHLMNPRQKNQLDFISALMDFVLVMFIVTQEYTCMPVIILYELLIAMIATFFIFPPNMQG